MNREFEENITRRVVINHENSSNSSNLWISCPNPKPQAQLRLFCFPYAGTGVSVFHSWAKLLPSEIEFCLIHLPGRERRLREASYTQLWPLVEALGAAFQPYLDRPFTFFGHSMGALTSFELTRYLRRCYSIQPIHLFVSGWRAPQLLNPLPPLHQLPDPTFLEGLQHRYSGLSSLLQNPELQQLFLPILRADMAVVETYLYRHESPLDCPISTFGGRQDNLTTEEDLAAWQDQTQGPFRLRMFSGNHFFIQDIQRSMIQAFISDLTQDLQSTARFISDDTCKLSVEFSLR